MSDQFQPPQEMPSEEELRAQLERVRVQDVIVQTIVSIVNLTAAKADDKEQLRLGIEAAKALLPLVREELGPDAKSFDEAISQLQLVYAQDPEAVAAGEETGGDGAAPAAGAPNDPAAPKPGDPGPAQSSGKLWVPGR